MALVDDVRAALRLTTSSLDDEVALLVESAQADMVRVGLDEAAVADPDSHPLVKQAIVCYAKARFGYDEPDAERFDASYRQIVADLMNSPMNTSAWRWCGCPATEKR